MTDSIFDNVHAVNAWADSDPETLRISVDTKATVLVGAYSRGGRSRGQKPVAALDHDMRPEQKLAPGGIVEPVEGRAFVFFTQSNKTSDFVVDGLRLWWALRKHDLGHVRRLVINMDNGPKCSSHRRYFLQLLAQFDDMVGARFAHFEIMVSVTVAIQFLFGKFDISDDCRQNIIEVVGHAGCQGTDRLHLLG